MLFAVVLVTNAQTISANGFLLFWVDNNTLQGINYLNFKLTQSDQVYLTYPDGVTITDSLAFVSIGPDTSYGYFNDGVHPLVLFEEPTPNSTNYKIITNIDEIGSAFSLYPNPAKTYINIVTSDNTEANWELYNISGQVIRKGSSAKIYVNDLSAGLYLIRIDKYSKRFIKQ